MYIDNTKLTLRVTFDVKSYFEVFKADKTLN